MSYELLVFQSAEERSTCHACSGHKWENQDNIFGKETEKLLATCKHLFRVSIDLEPGDEAKLLKKIYGICKAHGVYIMWYGLGSPFEPDKFLISGRGHDRLGFIQF